MLHVRLLTTDELRDVYNRFLIQDFNEDERKPYATVEELIASQLYIGLGSFVGEELAAYALLSAGGSRRWLLLDYLACLKPYRGSGMGSTFLKIICNYLSEGRIPQTWQDDDNFFEWHPRPAALIIEVEDPQHQSESTAAELCKRRINFYKRCGFKETSLKSKLYNSHLNIMFYPLANESQRLSSALIKDELTTIYKTFYQNDFLTGAVTLKDTFDEKATQ